jgi:hypothetical protein
MAPRSPARKTFGVNIIQRPASAALAIALGLVALVAGAARLLWQLTTARRTRRAITSRDPRSSAA